MTETAARTSAAVSRPRVLRTLFWYRVLAFATGIALLTGTTALILKSLVHVPHMEPGTGLVWLFHGWLYLAYVVVTAMLGLKMRWPLHRYAVVMAAGMIPTASFIAEHYVNRDVRRRLGL